LSATVHVLDETKATPAQLLENTLERARNGEFVDMIVISTDRDGEIDFGWSNCTASDLALAAVLLADKARELARK